jgi:hypothetical protein
MSRVLHFLFLASVGAVLFLVVGPGCGRSSLEPESLTDAAAPGSCGPSTCPTGCCDATGTCRTGRDVRACGSIGARCSDCVATGFSVCSTSRVCGRDDPSCGPASCSGCCSVDEGRLRCLSGTEPSACGRSGAQCLNCTGDGRTCDPSTRACGTTSCNPSNCSGCCVGDRCLPGDAALACGDTGAQCDSCAVGQVCRAQSGGGGRCEGTSSCGPANCGGCCNAAGQCVAGNDTTACGRGGERCAACGIAQVCIPEGQPNARSCQTPPACGPTNCTGCCVGNQCVAANATTPQRCGLNGQQCQACPAGQVCNQPTGTCVPAPECSPASCPLGCCLGDICAFGQQNTACGTGGDACVNCQNLGRVCEANSCQPPSCNPDNCRTGCCDGNQCVNGTGDDACGAIGGGQCQDCAAAGEVCVNRQCRERCGPANCGGCCQPNNSCPSGVANDACGVGGGACGNCAAQGSFCNGLVSPRRCNNQQNTCPAVYGGCPGGVALPNIPATQNLCSDAELLTIGANCADGPDLTGCVNALASVAPACSTCLDPFKHPFVQNVGLWACAAAFVLQPCRRAMGCAADCAQTSCNQCAPASENQCYTLVNGLGNQCGTAFVAADTCADAALDPGQLCSAVSYTDYGQWLRAVGDHFCGNGP